MTLPETPPDVPATAASCFGLKRVLAGIGVAGIIAAAGAVFGAGRASESFAHSVEDHDQRLDKVEPKVEAIERAIPRIDSKLDGIERDVREIRDWLRPPRQPR